MYEIKMRVQEKAAFYAGGETIIVCDNADYELALELDAEWDPFETVTVLFTLPACRGTIEVLCTGRRCAVPQIQVPGVLRVGVTAGEQLHTTRWMELNVIPSIRTSAGRDVATIPPDLAQQIIGRLDELENRDSGTSFEVGNALELDEGVLNVKTTDLAEEGNALPITSGGVYKIVDDIIESQKSVLFLTMAPDQFTEGKEGQFAFDIIGKKLYVCTYAEPSNYEWVGCHGYQIYNYAPDSSVTGSYGDLVIDVVGKSIYVCAGENVDGNGVSGWNWVKIGSDVELDTTLLKEGAAADAKAVGERIGELYDAVKYDEEKWGEATVLKTTAFGVEFGGVTWENGYLNASNGTVYSKTDTNWWHTPDYISVKAGDVIRITDSIKSHTNVAMIAAYDESKAYLSARSVKLVNGDTEYTVSADSGVAFVRLSLGNGTGYEAQEIQITTHDPVDTPKENIDHIYERLGSLDNTVKLYSNTMPLIGKTVFLAGDSRSSTDYKFYKALLEEKSGCLALNQGASGKNAAYNASDEYFERLRKNEHDFSIWLVGGNNTGSSVGTFSADSVNGKAGETVVEETDISVDYSGTTFVQAIDHIMRKYKAMFYDFKKLGNRRFPRMIFCTDLPQQRGGASSEYSKKENWERKRNAILECAEKNGVACLDLYKLCGFDMSFEPYWKEPTDKVNDNGLYYMDGLHPNQYGMDIVTSLEIEEMKKYIMTTDYIKPWTMTEDGLIMYCDGLNNTGNGHDSTVTTWVDLSGNGNDIINVASSTATTPAATVQGEWLADGIHVINGSKQYLRTVNTFDLGADRTVELRLTMNADANMTVGLYQADRLKLRSGGAKFWTRYGTSESSTTYDINPGKQTRYNVPFTVTMSRHYDAETNKTTHRVYVDGVFYSEKSWDGNLREGDATHVYIGSEYTNVTVHAMRIYDRALTDEEVKSNYWYDVERFEKAAAE